MGIYLSGGDVCVSEHHLHSAQVGTVAEKVGGKGVPDHMGRDVLVDTGDKRRLANYLPEPQPCHTAAPSGNKEIIASLTLEDEWPCCFQILFDFFFCLVTKGNQAFFITFAQDPDKTGGKITCSQGQLDQLGHPQSGRIEKKEHGVIPYTNRGYDVWWGQKAPDFFLGKCFRQTLTAAWEVDCAERVMGDQIFPEQECEK